MAVATTSICTMRTSSATQPTPEIALSATRSASCTICFATDTPNREGDCRSLGDAEHGLVPIVHCEDAEFGTGRNIVAELSCTTTLFWTEDAVSCIYPTTYCELDWNKSCDRVSEGDAIFPLHSIAVFYSLFQSASRCLL